MTAYADRLVFAFAALPGARVSFTLEPQHLGSSSGTVTVRGSRPVHLQQLVYP